MKGIVLAAGRGSRMGGHCEELPKCLLEVDGRPLIQWQLDAMEAAEIEEVAIVTGFRADLLDDFGTHGFENQRWAETHSVMSLACAADWLERSVCIVSYGDVFYEPHAVRALAESDAEIALAFDPAWRSLWEKRFADPLDDAESFRVDSDGNLIEIGRRPHCADEIQGQPMGLLRTTPTGWCAIEHILERLPGEERDRMALTSLLGRLIEAGVRIDAVPYRGRWGEIDQPSDLILYRGAATGAAAN